MASCPGNAISDDFPEGCRGCVRTLAHLVVWMGTAYVDDATSILPQPDWCDEATQVGMYVDGVRAGHPA